MNKTRDFKSKSPNFRSLQELAQNNPREFEARRDEIISSFMATIPKKYQRSMYGLQWRIDRTREIAKTPLIACIEISKMMFNSVDQLQSQARLLQQGINGEKSQHTEKNIAKILAFKNTIKAS